MKKFSFLLAAIAFWIFGIFGVFAVNAQTICNVNSQATLTKCFNDVKVNNSYLFVVTDDFTTTNKQYALSKSNVTVTIVSDGDHTIKAYNTTTGQNIFSLSSSFTLNLGDPNGIYPGILTVDGDNQTVMNRFITLTGSATARPTLNLYDGVVIKNYTATKASMGNGMAIYNNQGTVNIYGGKISHCGINTSSKYYLGGAIYNYGSLATLNMSGGTIEDCHAYYGGGVYVRSGTFNMTGGDITECSAYYDGGGIMGGILDNNATYSINISGDAKITKNKTTWVGWGYGGGIHNSLGTLTITGGEISDNNASSQGGAIYNTAGTVNISGNTKILRNTAVRSGGAIGNFAGMVNQSQGIYAPGILTISDSVEIKENSANTGGAIINFSNRPDIISTTTINGGTFSENTSTDYGGVILNQGDNDGAGVLIINGGTFIDNSSGSTGGVIASVNNGKVTINDGEITGNTATTHGGAIYLKDGASLDVEGGKIEENTAAANGGAIYSLDGSNVIINGGEITANEGLYGGGIYSTDTSKLTVNAGANIYANTGSTGANDIYVVTPSDLIVLSDDANSGKQLDGEDITGWFYDYSDKRWGTGEGQTIEEIQREESGQVKPVDEKTDLQLIAAYASSGYIVKFDKNAPKKDDDTDYPISGTMEDQQINYDEYTALSANEYKDDAGLYVFTGWNTKANGTGDSYTDKEEVKNLCEPGGTEKEITLYAQWKKAEYTVKFDSNPPETGYVISGTMADQKMQYDKDTALSENQFSESKSRYVFTGWNTQPDGSGAAYTDQQVVNNLAGTGTEITLYAQWTLSVTSFSGEKYWAGDAAGTTHNNESEVSLTLYRISAKEGAKEEAVVVVSPITFAWDGNAFTYTNLPEYDSEGYLYTYSVKEAEISDYTTTYSADTSVITNTKNWAVRYKFEVDPETATKYPGKKLPDAVLAVLPEAEGGKANGTTVTPTDPKETTVKDTDGTWIFVKWDPASGVINGGDFTFTGYWKFTENDVVPPTIKVSEESAAGQDESGVYTSDEVIYEITYTNYLNEEDDVVITFVLPEGTEYVPTEGDDAIVDGRTVKWIRTTEGGESGTIKVKVQVSAELVKKGGLKNIQAEATAVVGGQDPLPTNQVENPVLFKVNHEFESSDPDHTLPDNLPTPPSTIYDKKNGDNVNASDSIKVGTEVLVEDGVWTFLGWDQSSGTINNEDFVFHGIWKFTTIPHADPSVRKVIREGDGSETDSFTFRMTSVGNTAGLEVNPMPAGSSDGQKTVTITGEQEFEFGDFSFRKAGEYVYEIAETTGDLSTYVYDATVYTVTWYVEEDEDGNFTAEMEVEVDGESIEVSEPFTFEFENIKLPDNAAYPVVRKVISGGTPPANDTFTFTLTALSNTAGLPENPMPDGASGGTATIEISGAGRNYFGLIEFTKDGDYSYEIEEIAGTSNVFAYDTCVYTVTWHVKDGKVSAEILKDEQAWSGNEFVFDNEYLAGGGIVNPKVVKKIVGTTNRQETFSFELKSSTNTAGLEVNPMPKGSIKGTKTIWIIGEGERGFGSFAFTKPGVYVYTIKEIPGNSSKWEYDSSEYTLTYQVTQNGDELDVTLTVHKDHRGVDVNKFTFVNLYESGGGNDGGGGDGGGIGMLPRTGFAPGIRTQLPEMKVNYSQYSTLSLEIPGLGVNAEILGVPMVDGTWDVSWLGDKVGWLESTAYPGYVGAGNVVLTGHSINWLGNPGIFAKLEWLGYGAPIILNAYGEKLTYSVQDVQTVYADTPQVLSQKTDDAMLTLITCKYYNEATGQYDGRVVVRAKLASVSAAEDGYRPMARAGEAAGMSFGENLPKMGFPPASGRVLSERPKNVFYSPIRFRLEIPKLDLSAGLIEIPFVDGDYPVEWMGDTVGVLEGSAMPGEGQSVIVAHNHLDADAAGPFAELFSLDEGDRIFVTDNSGSLQVFAVYANLKVNAYDVERVRAVAAENSRSITFITCEDELVEGGYANRRIVAAAPVGK